MRILSVRGCVLRIHPLFPVLLLFLSVSGAYHFVAAYLIVLLLHESAHLLCAVALHIPVAQIELTPFGGSMQIPFVEALPRRKAFLLSSAGILCNLLVGTAAFILSVRLSILHPFLLYFIQCNLLMLCINLLPVLPLDGGRMLLALLSKYFDRSLILHILLTAGRALSASLLLFGIYKALLGSFRSFPVLLAFYLLYAAAIEEKTGVSRYLASFMARRIRIEKHKTLPVCALCAAASMPVFMLLPQLHPGAYHIIYIIDENSLSVIGQLRENELLSAVLDHAERPLHEIVHSPQ